MRSRSGTYPQLVFLSGANYPVYVFCEPVHGYTGCVIWFYDLPGAQSTVRVLLSAAYAVLDDELCGCSLWEELKSLEKVSKESH